MNTKGNSEEEAIEEVSTGGIEKLLKKNKNEKK